MPVDGWAGMLPVENLHQPVVTMGRSVGQVEIPDSAHHIDWRVGNPAGADLDKVRRVRDDITRRINTVPASYPASTPDFTATSVREVAWASVPE